MEADKRETGISERAVSSIRRLTALATEVGEGDDVRAALERELRVVLDRASVMVVIGDERASSRDSAAVDEAGEGERGQRAAERRAELEWRAAVGGHQALMVRAGRTGEPDGEAPAAVAVLVEVAALVLALRGARDQAASDELTGCRSRRAGLSRLGEELARSARTGAPVSCLMLDIDNLKQINDTFGHLEGDRVLREAGASLRRQLRAYDLAARYGGDEFLVVLPAADHDAARRAATRMTDALARIRSPAHPSSQSSVSASAGAATARPGEASDAVLTRADQALLAAKRRTHGSRPPTG